MSRHSDRRLVVILSLALFGLSAKVEAQHSSEVVLDLRTMTVEYSPALRADDPSHQMLLSATSGSPAGHVRVAQIETDASIGIAGVEIAVDEPEAVESNSSTLSELLVVQYDLWLAGSNDDWTLDIADVQDSAATGPSDILGTVPLTHTTVAVSSPTFIAGLIPTGSDDARLLLRWGRHEWAAGVHFSIPRESRPRQRDPLGDQRTFEFDTTEIQRSNRLTRRNIATVWLPDGPRLMVVYGRNMRVEDRDFAHLVSVATDNVVTMTASAVIRLDLDVPLQFGEMTLGTGNVGGLRGSPGGYGVWLKRAADGWRLVFNDEPDAWGTQHDPAFDAGEVSLDYVQAEDSSRALSASVVMTTPDQGRFVLIWGPHEWSADFTVLS